MIPIRTRSVVRWMTAVGAFLVMSAAAPAFFFKGWPGDGREQPRSLLRPGNPDAGGRPPGETDEPNPDDGTSSPGGGGPIAPDVPEPVTAVLAAVGIGVVAIARSRGRKCMHDFGQVADARDHKQ